MPVPPLPLPNMNVKRADELKPGDCFVSNRWKGRVFSRTVEAVSVGHQFGRTVAHVVTKESGVLHIPAGREVELIAPVKS